MVVTKIDRTNQEDFAAMAPAAIWECLGKRGYFFLGAYGKVTRDDGKLYSTVVGILVFSLQERIDEGICRWYALIEWDFVPEKYECNQIRENLMQSAVNTLKKSGVSGWVFKDAYEALRYEVILQREQYEITGQEYDRITTMMKNLAGSRLLEVPESDKIILSVDELPTARQHKLKNILKEMRQKEFNQISEGMEKYEKSLSMVSLKRDEFGGILMVKRDGPFELSIVACRVVDDEDTTVLIYLLKEFVKKALRTCSQEYVLNVVIQEERSAALARNLLTSSEESKGKNYYYNFVVE